MIVTGCREREYRLARVSGLLKETRQILWRESASVKELVLTEEAPAYF
jgi:hypothetical protein